MEAGTKSLVFSNSKELTRDAIEACKALFINPRDLFEDYCEYDQSVPQNIQELRKVHTDRLRKKKICEVQQYLELKRAALRRKRNRSGFAGLWAFHASSSYQRRQFLPLSRSPLHYTTAFSTTHASRELHSGNKIAQARARREHNSFILQQRLYSTLQKKEDHIRNISIGRESRDFTKIQRVIQSNRKLESKILQNKQRKEQEVRRACTLSRVEQVRTYNFFTSCHNKEVYKMQEQQRLIQNDARKHKEKYYRTLRERVKDNLSIDETLSRMNSKIQYSEYLSNAEKHKRLVKTTMNYL